MSEEKEEVVLDKGNALPTKTTKEVNVYQDNRLSSINLFDKQQLESAKGILEIMMRSEKGGIKSINDGIAILLRAQDLQLPFSTCIEHIHVINGKTGVDIHVIKSLLLRAGVTWKCVKDYTPLYEYTDSINVYCENKLPEHCIKCKSSTEAAEKAKDDLEHIYVYPVKYYSDFNGNIYKDYQLNSKFAIAVNRAQANEIAKSGKCPIFRIASQPIDYYTEYELSRYIEAKGKIKEMKVTNHFSISEAREAGLLEKDNWGKYPRIMLANRAFTYAARDIADDLLMGVMENGELKIIEDVNLSDDDFVRVEEV